MRWFKFLILAVLLSQPAAAQSPPAASAPQPVGSGAVPTPAPIGAWRFIVEKNRPVAMAVAAKTDVAEYIVGIRIECGAGGRLEYVPIALRLKPWKDLWVHGLDDIEHTIPLVGFRVKGADNVLLSKEFAASEANYVRQGKGHDWTMSMSLDGPDKGVADIKMAGFGKVRSFMLSACRGVKMTKPNLKILGVLALAPMSLTSPASANEQMGMVCEIGSAAQRSTWHISADLDAGRYSVRLGDSFFRRNEEMTIDYGMTPTTKPKMNAFKFILKGNATQYFLVVKLDTGQAYTTSILNDFAKLIGTCKDDTFKGL